MKGLHLVNDQTVDCYLFRNALANLVKDLSLYFKFKQNIQTLVIEDVEIEVDQEI
ncbi:hypothetical protein [Acinetobacter bereziniae]|uniref:hypothetical protein n=1 Tax=Acinetobacter bereziniae TaxID=106648 RepID=UPI0013CE727F|nr:hypothetical protein [Acinetobacter bereziniae]